MTWALQILLTHTDVSQIALPETSPPPGQIRLAELSVFNWGSFHGLHTARIDPHGTLITGDNGSGKSTLVDALMALLLPPSKAAFNIAAAQGDRSDRSLLSYMRGAFGSDHDGDRTRVRHKREGATRTGLRALFRSDDGTELTLAVLFWTTKPSQSLADVQRLYVIARYNYSLKDLLTRFSDGNVRELKQGLRNDKHVQLFDQSFEQYRENYQRALRISNRNAPQLLQRALGLKKIDDLTDLIRNLVLEPSRVREDARRAVSEFDDLKAIHRQMTDAKRQAERLADLPATVARIHLLTDKISAVDEEQLLISEYFAAQAERLWLARRQANKEQLKTAQHTLSTVQDRHATAQTEEKERYADYRAAGGDRIEQCRRELEHASRVLQRTTTDAATYQTTIKALGLPAELDYEAFSANQARGKQALQSQQANREKVQTNFGLAASHSSNINDQLKELREQLANVKSRPDSNIDARYQSMRDEMADALSVNKADLPFIGELIEVKDDQHAWQGAIERALGGLRTTIAVPEDVLKAATAWINQRHTGLHVRLQVVSDVKGAAQFRPDGYLRKLEWRKHRYREWLKHHLARFDLECVDTTDILNRTAYAMTREGLIHREKGRFVKNDSQRVDDRRHWSLGFSNAQRVALLERDLASLTQQAEQALLALEDARRTMDAFNETAQHWERLATFNWQEIDVTQAQTAVQTLQAELAQFQSGTELLKQSEQRWRDAESRLEVVASELEGIQKSIWTLEQSIKSATQAIEHAKLRQSEQPDEAVLARLHSVIGKMNDADLDRLHDIESEHKSRLHKHKGTLVEEKAERFNQAIGIMARFKSMWEPIAVDWGDSALHHTQDYLDHLEKLREERLPDLIEQFSNRLNLHTTQSLANIREKIESERDEIRDRIEVINRVLMRTEFKPGTCLRLRARREAFQHVQQFDDRLKELLGQSSQEDHEKRFSLLQELITTLDKASSTATANTLESLRLLDARYRMSFFAEEIEQKSGKVVDVLESSSGKSGGEKESFAGTIVAASLAYVLTPPDEDVPSYCTVFLDEAFSNTAEAVSRRVLKVFQELNIHINLITPYKNLNLARESARSLLITERNGASHESRLCEVTWEEIDQQLAARSQRIAREASSMGIVMDA